jgi:hypothetical protein
MHSPTCRSGGAALQALQTFLIDCRATLPKAVVAVAPGSFWGIFAPKDARHSGSI